MINLGEMLFTALAMFIFFLFIQKYFILKEKPNYSSFYAVLLNHEDTFWISSCLVGAILISYHDDQISLCYLPIVVSILILSRTFLYNSINSKKLINKVNSTDGNIKLDGLIDTISIILSVINLILFFIFLKV